MVKHSFAALQPCIGISLLIVCLDACLNVPLVVSLEATAMRVVLATVAVLFHISLCQTDPARKPHIVLIVADDLVTIEINIPLSIVVIFPWH